MVGKIRTIPDIWCEKKKKTFACIFFQIVHFQLTLTQQETFLRWDLPASNNSRCCSAPGVRLGGSWLQRPLQPAPHACAHALAWSCADPSPLIPFNPALRCWDHKYLSAALTICLICREDNILRSKYFPNESLCPKFNLLDTMDFFFKGSLQNIIAQLKPSWSIFQLLSGRALWLVCISAQNTFDNLCQYPVLVVLKFYNRVENC